MPGFAANAIRSLAVAGLLLGAAVASVPAQAGGPRPGAPPVLAAKRCDPIVLRRTPALAATLRRVHLMAVGTRRKVTGPLGRIYYGRCRSGSYYALATFSAALVGTADQPEAFSRRPGQRWTDRGDTGGAVRLKVPDRLLQAWGYPGFSPG